MHIPDQSSDLIEQRFLASEALALVMWRLFPNIILMGGGINSLGFYYDFIFEQPLSEGMYELIEVHLHRLMKEDLPVRFISMMRENAQSFFEHHKHFLLAELAGEQKSNILELVQIEDFYGLCPSLSLTSTQEIGHIKLLDSQQLIREIQGEEITVNRILATSQKSAKDLKIFLKSYESFLKKKDHRMLGPKLNLLSFSESMGALGVVWHPKGVQLQHILLDWLKKQNLDGDEVQISTPTVAQLDFLGEDTQSLEPFVFEGKDYRLRCSPLRQHLEFLRHLSLEKEEFPWRMTESSTVFRQYPEPQWWGLFCQCAYRSEFMTICCLKEQVIPELISSLLFIEQIITIFDFKAQWYLLASRQRSPKALQEQEAIGWLKQAIQAQPRSYSYFPEILEEEEGEGPCLELRVKDVLGREWPLSRLSVIQPIQKDISPSVQQEEAQKRVIVTRQVWESLDRLVALLIERYEGNFPLWLAPEQVRVMTIGEANVSYARQVSQQLRDKGLRVKLDIRQTKLGLRVHEAEKENVPYLVLLGDQERKKQMISVRTASKFNESQSVDIETFLNKIYQESLCPMPIWERAE